MALLLVFTTVSVASATDTNVTNDSIVDVDLTSTTDDVSAVSDDSQELSNIDNKDSLLRDDENEEVDSVNYTVSNYEEIDTTGYNNNLTEDSTTNSTTLNESCTITLTTDVVETSSKSISTADPTTNITYYVSNNGSNSNDGLSEETAFKTIEYALNMATETTVTYNIILLGGNYTGSGNTNLTVNGSKYINIIGQGNAVIDGEAGYDIQTSGYYWDSSEIWYYYVNGTGNWAMNITAGDGHIGIYNLTIQNCWSPGGNSISAYNVSTIDNYGNLTVDGVSFISNHAGVGGAIRNNHGATLLVNNSIFFNQTKSSSTGNMGGAIYNNGTAVIDNSTFQSNYSRWGTILNDGNLTIINSVIRDNVGYDGESTYKLGSGIAVNSGNADFYNINNIPNIITTIVNCTFINNDQTDVYTDAGELYLANCTFYNSTGLRTANSQSITLDITVINNTFDTIVGSTIETSMSSSSNPACAMYLSGNYNFYIINNTVTNLDSTLSTSVAIRLASGNATIIGNNLSRTLYVRTKNNTIVNNTITTTQDLYAINLTSNATNNTITDNYVTSTIYVGSDAINGTTTSNIIENNTPIVETILISDFNYDKYFNSDGTLRSDYRDNVTSIIIYDTLSNCDIVLDTGNTINVSQNNSSVTSYNVTITVKNNTSVTIDSLNINNTNSKSVLVIETDGNNVTNNNLSTNEYYTINVTGTDNIISSNYLISDLLTGDAAILAEEDNTISNNTPTYTGHIYIVTDDNYYNYFSEGNCIIEENDITIVTQGALYNKNFTFTDKNVILRGYPDSILYNSTITVTGNSTINMTHVTIDNTDSSLTQAIILESNGNNIAFNNIYYDGTNTFTAIGILSSNNEVSSNIITITGSTNNATDSTVNGITIQSIGNGTADNNTVYNNTININSTGYVYSINIGASASNNNILNNTIIANATETVYGIQIATIPEVNTIITGNKINVTSPKLAYGVVVGSNTTGNISSNQINATADQVYVIEVYDSVYDLILNNNTLRGIGNYTVGIDVINSQDSRITNNTVTANGTEVAYGIQIATLSEVNTTIYNNRINVTSPTLAYGVVLGSNTTGNISFNIINATADQIYLIEAYDYAHDITFGNNTLYGKGNYTVGIGIVNSHDILITNNTIRINGTTNGTTTSDNIISPTTVGIYLYNTTNIYINSSYPSTTSTSQKINVTNGTGIHIIDSSNVTIYKVGIVTYHSSNVQDALVIENSNDITVYNGSIRASGYAITAQDSVNINIFNMSGNTITTTGLNLTSAHTNYAIKLVNSTNIKVNNSRINGSMYHGNSAVEVIDCTNVSVYNNTPFESSIELDTTGLAINQSGTVYVNILTDIGETRANGTATVTIAGTTYTVTIRNGVGSFTYTPTTTDPLDVTVTFKSTYPVRADDATLTTQVELENFVDLSIDEATISGNTVTITANVEEYGVAVDDGYMIIKVNGVTLRDDEGNVIKVYVENGVATYEYTLPSVSSDRDYEISAVYAGSTVIRSDVLTVTVTPGTVNIVVSTDGTLKPGETVTFTATITDSNGNHVTSGKVVFKLNGKTLRDADGNVIYGYVDENGIAFIEYLIPDNYSAKDYVLTAVFTGSGFERSEANTPITLTKTNTKITASDITISQGDNTQLTATITDEEGNLVVGTTKVVVKINGKTFTQVKVVDGVIDLTLYTSSFTDSTYTITIMVGENSYYNKAEESLTLTVVE